ncbi:MAG: hypothetical protein RLZZ627_1441 [Pseudomonadota bacterium]|jgi:uncharacterized protein (DUF1501 family)
MNRRQFILRSGHALGATALLAGLGQLRVAEAADYKALVCVFLFGGNDGNNTLIPLDSQGYGQYAAIRPASSNVNIPQANWLPINAAGKSFGLHPSLSGVQGLYHQGHLAWVANVGTLVQPTTRAQFVSRGVPVPSNLFSHSDQQYQWQTATTSASPSPSGWGGRLADQVAPVFNAGGSFPSLTNMSGVTIFTRGLSAGVISPGPSSLQGFGSGVTDQARYTALREIESLSSGYSLINALNGMTAGGIDATNQLNQALASQAPLTTSFPGSSLGNQLKGVANIIAARGALGNSRQIFFCAINGFDTHTNQLSTQANLLSDLDASLKAFHDATVELGVENAVTTFTHSDFGRTFQPTAGGGSDHAWGSHHLVMGGSVRGGSLYGQYPQLLLSGPDDADNEGRWVPSTGVCEFVYPLIRWFGATNIQQVLPHLGNFNLARTDLNYL